jgi:flagellar export protein FliJ
MTTPYDAARRWRKDDLDQVRRELTVLHRRRDDLDAQLSSLDALLAREAGVAPAVPFANFGAFHGQVQAQKGTIAQAIAAVDDDIARVSDLVARAFEDFKVLDIAAERYATEQREQAARREQTELDDIAGQRAARSDDYAVRAAGE